MKMRRVVGIVGAGFVVVGCSAIDVVGLDEEPAEGGSPDATSADAIAVDAWLTDDAALETGAKDAASDVADAGDTADAYDAYEAGPDPHEVVEIAQEDASTCARFADGRVKCWGENSQGQLGLGDKVSRGDNAGEMGDALPYVDLGAGRTAKQIVAGGLHVCALLDNDTVKCWGKGKIGLGEILDRGDQPGEMGDSLPATDLGGPVASLASGFGHVCAILVSGVLKCWGGNSHGELGLGDTNARGDQPGEMGANLPAIDLGAGRVAKSVTLGERSTCAILDDDSLKCWGDNTHGELGQGDVNHRGDNAAEMGDNLLAIDLGAGRTAKIISAGVDDVCALLDDATVKCWGSNFNGRLGQGDLKDRGDQPNEMGDNLVAVNLGAGLTPKGVYSGAGSNCVLFTDDTLKCWGLNSVGQLGLGDTNDRSTPDSIVDLGAGLKVKRFVGSHWMSPGAILSNGAVKIWGWNHGAAAGVGGQLGQGDMNDRGDGPNEMGDNLLPVQLFGP